VDGLTVPGIRCSEEGGGKGEFSPNDGPSKEEVLHEKKKEVFGIPQTGAMKRKILEKS